MRPSSRLLVLAVVTVAGCGGGSDDPVVPKCVVTAVSVDPTAVTLTIGESRTIAVTVSHTDCGTPAVSWNSSAPSIASVSNAGEVQAVTAGSASITASFSGRSATVAVTVVEVPVASVQPFDIPASQGGTTRTLTAVPLDAHGNALANRVCTWSSSNPTAATVTSPGLTTTLRILGTLAATTQVTITVTCEGQAAAATFTAAPIPVASAVVTTSAVEAGVNQPVQLRVTLRDGTNNVLFGRAVVWSVSDMAVATVPAGSDFTDCGAEGAVCAFTGTRQVRYGADGIYVYRQKTNGTPCTNAVFGDPVPGVVKRCAFADLPTTADGRITATIVGLGNVTVVATPVENPGAVSAQVAFSGAVSVASVTVTPPNADLDVGGSVQLSAVVKDGAGNVLPNRTIVWSTLDTTVMLVSPAGLARTVWPGATTVRATVEGKVASAALTVRKPVLAFSASGLSGHIGSFAAAAPPEFSYGISFYTTISQLTAEQAQHAQLGWGTWTMPDNFQFSQPLCPAGTFARDNWPERGPTYRDVFQTLEGGAGQWTTTRFPSRTPKFRINSTPDCYSNQVSSPGWSFYGERLPDDRLGLVQLSNRVLYPPDGLPMETETGPVLFGYGWLALPLIPGYTKGNGLVIGNQSWTLFYRASNFAGPVAFIAPELWELVASADRTGAGRGLDAQPSVTGSAALEIGNMPHFTGQDSSGVRYRRIPRLTFPLSGANQSTLLQDVRLYARSAAWDGFAAWMQGGGPVTQVSPNGTFNQAMSGSAQTLYMDGKPVDVTPVMSSVIVGAGGASGIGLRWTAASLAGVIPEFYRETASGWTAVPPWEVPRTTWLVDQTFPAKTPIAFPSLDASAGSPWQSSGWSAGPFTTTLNDGSVVDYVWYRFIDQPAIARLGLAPVVRAQLQQFVETLHQQAGLAGVSIAPPSSGTLATIDRAAIVTPPAGLAAGYVPIVIAQR